MCCTQRKITHWFPKYVDEFQAFSWAFNEEPKKLSFLISFAPFQSQLILLIPPAWTDVTFFEWFFSVGASQMVVETFDLMVGIQAKTLADALDPQGQSTEDLIVRIIFLY
eukprot:UN27472